MSNDTETTTVADSIQDSLGGAVDSDEIESMLEDDAIDSVGRELGSRIGREVGSRIGRELGPSVAIDIRERKRLRTILRNAGRRLVVLLVRALKNVDLESGISKLRDVGRDVMSADSVKDGLESALPGETTDSADGESGEAAEAEVDEESADDAEAGEATEDGEEDGADTSIEVPSDVDLSADEIQNLKEDTYRELLETMSYRDLQSVAKDVGVKANLAQDEMTDRIVDAFSEEGET